jgi:hypothetical protein
VDTTLNQLAHRAKALAGAVLAAVVAYAGDAIQSGTALSLHGAEMAAVAAVVTGLGVHQTVNAKNPKKR